MICYSRVDSASAWPYRALSAPLEGLLWLTTFHRLTVVEIPVEQTYLLPLELAVEDPGFKKKSKSNVSFIDVDFMLSLMMSSSLLLPTDGFCLNEDGKISCTSPETGVLWES